MRLKVEEEKVRIDKYLSLHTDYSRSFIKKMIQDGNVLLNGKVIDDPAYLVLLDQEIEMKEETFSTDLVAEEIPLDIVFENENIIVVNKPSGMVVHPGSGNFHGTLVNALLTHTNSLSDKNGSVRPGIVHRIDKDTSGLLLIAKNNKAHEILADNFKDKQVKRKYLALVCGVLKHQHVTIDAPIGRDEKNRLKMAVTEKNSKHAVTHVNVIKRYQENTLVECVLETGRTHQIRVHLAYIGHPVFNDPIYGREVIPGFGQFLHSSEMTFQEPITKEELHFHAPLPQVFQDYLDQLEENKK